MTRPSVNEVRNLAKAGIGAGGDCVWSFASRGVNTDDVAYALRNAVAVRADGQGCIVTGPALDGSDLEVIATVANGRIEVLGVCF